MENDDIKNDRDSERLPNQQELERELSEYLSKKYGNRIKIISPFLFPKGQEEETDEGLSSEKKE
jgi:ATP-dependent Clp protease ATP-binding subunit ClpX